MRIAILTQPLDTNYGGILQCYALQTFLERMGHEAQVLTKLRYGSSYYVIYPVAEHHQQLSVVEKEKK